MRVIKRKTTKTITIKKTNSSSNTSSSNTSTNTNTSNNTSNTNYNDILNKLNNYALKSDLNGYLQNGALSNYVTNSDLLAALANIKQCNCKNGTTLPTNTDNNVLNELIRKLNNYGIFQYDVAGKETIVTEFFPHLTTQNTTGNYSVGHSYLPLSQDFMINVVLNQQDNPNINKFDYIYIDTPTGRKTINECSLSKYFIFIDNAKFIVSTSILNEPVTIITNNGIKSIHLWYEQTDNSFIEAPVEFISSSIFTKNDIACEFNGSYTQKQGVFGTITLTMPENVSLVYNTINADVNTWSINCSNNIITLNNPSSPVAEPYGFLTKQIIIADSSTKRYVIKINCEATALPPNY